MRQLPGTTSTDSRFNFSTVSKGETCRGLEKQPSRRNLIQNGSMESTHCPRNRRNSPVLPLYGIASNQKIGISQTVRTEKRHSVPSTGSTGIFFLVTASRNPIWLVKWLINQPPANCSVGLLRLWTSWFWKFVAFPSATLNRL